MKLPRRDAGIDLSLAVAEARDVTMGLLTAASGNKTAGSAARVEGSVWATNLALSTYADLMLTVPHELTSVATTLYCMVREKLGVVHNSWPCFAPMDCFLNPYEKACHALFPSQWRL